MSRAKRQTCTFHCRECDSHFSSLGAFDKHREGDHTVERYCVEPADVLTKDGEPALFAKTDSGFCDLQRGGPRSGVTIWTVPYDTAFQYGSWEKEEA